LIQKNNIKGAGGHLSDLMQDYLAANSGSKTAVSP